jgi:hypothetical protein
MRLQPGVPHRDNLHGVRKVGTCGTILRAADAIKRLHAEHSASPKQAAQSSRFPDWSWLGGVSGNSKGNTRFYRTFVLCTRRPIAIEHLKPRLLLGDRLSRGRQLHLDRLVAADSILRKPRSSKTDLPKVRTEPIAIRARLTLDR